MVVSLQKVCDDDKWKIHKWRNLSSNRRQMLTKHIITVDEHTEWWNKVSLDPRILLFKVLSEEKVISIVIMKRLCSDSWHFAFYLTDIGLKNPWSAIFWTEELTLKQAIKLEARELICDVLRSNSAVIALHQRFGFAGNEEKSNDEVVVLELRL